MFGLTPVADTAPQSNKVDMLIAHPPARSTVPGQVFTGERARKPTYAQITVSIPPGGKGKVGEVA
ncbi:esterase/lipase superfamily enzyme [Ensifer sp. 4252]